MCNIAGFIGHEQAAPILLEMMERQEGWGGGYYSGLATISDGVLHMRKVVGDIATLRRETDAADLPGTIGIIHSRSKSGGDREWGHPFTDPANRMAYIANGALGAFAETTAVDKHVDQLRKNGYNFRSQVDGPVGTYPRLKDGACIHFSEIMCCLVDFLTHESGDRIQAMGKALQQFPGEIVALSLGLENPEEIAAFRCNMPLMAGRSANALYLATTALAFPETKLDWLLPIPANSAVSFSLNGVRLLPLLPAPGNVGEFQPLRSAAEDLIRDALATRGELGAGQLCNAVASLWKEGVIPQKAMLVYECLRHLRNTGEVDFETRSVAGVLPDTKAPRLVARLATKE